ncbi:MAG: hypothetical protein ABIW32_03585 [Terrimesophilobacter sp.]
MTAGSAPALAASSVIEFSSDGVNYSSSLASPLFQNIAQMVPGDSQTSTFWIRNAASSAGFLRLVLSDVTSSDPALASALTLRIKTDTFIDQRVTLNQATPCWVLAEDFLNPTTAVKVVATLTLGDLRSTDGQNVSASFRMRAGLSDASFDSLPSTSCGGTTTGVDVLGVDPPRVAGSLAGLAFTGSELPYLLLITSAGALGVGLFLLIAAKRRRQEDE